MQFDILDLIMHFSTSDSIKEIITSAFLCINFKINISRHGYDNFKLHYNFITSQIGFKEASLVHKKIKFGRCKKCHEFGFCFHMNLKFIYSATMHKFYRQKIASESHENHFM